MAFWFHVDPGRLTAYEKIGYRANLERVKAQDRIHRGDFDQGDYLGAYDLYMTAYGDPELAMKAKCNAAEVFAARSCNGAR